MAVNMAVMPFVLIILLFAGAALRSKSIMLASVGIYLVLGYVSVRSGNNLMIGVYTLGTFFMVMSTGVYLTKSVMGDTA